MWKAIAGRIVCGFLMACFMMAAVAAPDDGTLGPFVPASPEAVRSSPDELASFREKHKRAQDVTAPPAVGRYVFVQQLGSYQTQFVLDSATGRMWMLILEGTNAASLYPLYYQRITGWPGLLPDGEDESRSLDLVREPMNAEALSMIQSSTNATATPQRSWATP